VAAAGEDQREREVGDRRVEDARRIRHRDPAVAAGSDVDSVVADAVVRHQTQVGEEVELLRADPGDDCHEHLRARHRPRRRPRVQHLDLRQLVPCLSGQALRGDDAHAAVSPEPVAKRA